jgi:hypothetical protein
LDGGKCIGNVFLMQGIRLEEILELLFLGTALIKGV